jgi:hypothetical protein
LLERDREDAYSVLIKVTVSIDRETQRDREDDYSVLMKVTVSIARERMIIVF